MRNSKKRKQNINNIFSIDNNEHFDFSDNIQEITKELEAAKLALQKSLKEVEDLFISEPRINAKELKALISSSWEGAEKCSYEWAKYGWTIIWRAPPGLYLTFPNSIEQADAMAFRYVDESIVDPLFQKS